MSDYYIVLFRFVLPAIRERRRSREECFLHAWVEERFLWALETRVRLIFLDTPVTLTSDIIVFPVTLMRYFSHARRIVNDDVRGLRVNEASYFHQTSWISGMNYRNDNELRRRWLYDHHWAWCNGWFRNLLNYDADGNEFVYDRVYDRPCCDDCGRSHTLVMRVTNPHRYICVDRADCEFWQDTEVPQLLSDSDDD